MITEACTERSRSEQVLEDMRCDERKLGALRRVVNEGRTLANRAYRELFDVGNQTAARELRGLAERGLARSVGRGRGTRYEGI